MHRYLRVIAALVVVAIGVSSVVPLVCAHECALHTTAATEGASEHCHNVDTTETRTLGSAGPEGCSPLSLRDIALRERPNEPIRTAPLAVAHRPVRDDYFRRHLLVARRTHSGRLCAGLSPGAHLPLRI